MAASKGQGPRTGRAREPGGLVVLLKGLQKGRNLTAGLLAEGLSAERRLVQARGKCGRARLPLAAVPLSALSPSGTEFLSWAYSFQGSLLHRMRSCEVGEGDEHPLSTEGGHISCQSPSSPYGLDRNCLCPFWPLQVELVSHRYSVITVPEARSLGSGSQHGQERVLF